MRQKNIRYIGPLHEEWVRGLEFYELELRILGERLDEIAADNTSQEVAIDIEHFQNQLLIHEEYIAGLKQRIHENILQMERELEHGGTHLKEDTKHDFDQLEERYQTEEKLFNELRKDFNRFAAKWM